MSDTIAKIEDDAKATPSGVTGDKGSVPTKPDPVVVSGTPENAEGKLEPSAPGNTGTTPGSDRV